MEEKNGGFCMPVELVKQQDVSSFGSKISVLYCHNLYVPTYTSNSHTPTFPCTLLNSLYSKGYTDKLILFKHSIDDFNFFVIYLL